MRRPRPGREHDREILRLAVPAFGALVAEPLYVLVDTAFVGHLGTPQLAGLAVASNVLLTGFALCVFLAYGTTATVGRLIGRGDDAAAAREGVQGMWLALLVAVPLAVAAWFGAAPAVRAVGAHGDVATNAAVYLRLSAPGIPPLLVGLAGTGYLRGRQDTRTPLAVAVGTNVVNLAVEAFLIYGLHYGIGASAVATVLAQWVGGAVYGYVIARAVRAYDVPLHPDPRALRALTRAARDLLVRSAALRLALVLATVAATTIGTADVSAHQIALQVFFTLALALDAVAIAGQAMVAKALGAGDADAAYAMSRRMLDWGLGAGIALGVATAALRVPLAHVFTDDPHVVALAAFLLLHVAALQPVGGVVFALDGVLIGAGDVRFLAVAMVGASVVFAAAAAAVWALGWGVGWVWGALAVLMVARVVPLYRRFEQRAWLAP